MSSHSRLSPSAAHRWMNCPGCVREEAKYPEERSGPAAIDGTHTHTLLEQCINHDMVPAIEWLGRRMKDQDGEFTIDKERCERVQIALDYIEKRKAELGPETILISEKKVNPGPYLGGRDDVKGTCDVQLITPTYLEIIDYKDGMGVVEAKDNPQLILYALGVMAEYPELKDPAHIFRIRITIIQPKLMFKGMDAISCWDTNSQHIREKALELKAAAEATDDPNAPLKAGEWCKFCKHKACQVRVSTALKEAGIMFEDMSTTGASTDLTDEELVKILEKAKELEQMIEAAKSELQRRLESGKQIEGVKLVHGRGSYNWAYPEEEMVEKLKRMGIPKASIYVTSMVTPSAAKKLTWTKRDGSEKKLSDRQIKTLDNEYITKKEGKLTVALADDPRKAVIKDASSMFGSVTSEEDSLPAWLL